MSENQQSTQVKRGFMTDSSDFFTNNSKLWLGMAMEPFVNNGNGNQYMQKMMTLCFPWQNGGFKKPDLQTMLNGILEEQTLCPSLMAAWLDCNRKVMETLRTGITQQNGPAEVLKDCLQSVKEYGASCTEFMEGQLLQLSKTWDVQKMN